jgi:hypothetical protein
MNVVWILEKYAALVAITALYEVKRQEECFYLAFSYTRITNGAPALLTYKNL